MQQGSLNLVGVEDDLQGAKACAASGTELGAGDPYPGLDPGAVVGVAKFSLRIDFEVLVHVFVTGGLPDFLVGHSTISVLSRK